MKTAKYLSVLFLCLIGLQVFAQDTTKEEPPMPPARKAAIDSLALEKVHDLSKYISKIGDKETSFSEANRVIERALELFVEDAQMGVSTLGKKQIKYFGIRKYLERLNKLNYKSVNIDWFDIQYISDLEKQPDGRYVGVITVYQKFTGVTEDGLVYKDVTKKDITIYVERKTTQIGGREIGFWDVLLGDIRVSETKKG
ncbi:hypothetical protein EI427_05915 [Flammeovirga pectinis]|uniref:ABC transporter substrate-binding protein n=1 Tax=Flammeovirga pectinis TaxID=2494373 RepID=A0A3S9P0U1_9BACT|nr:hypothetical protein EI427_05915 [Flammeovirga pectinis]